MKRLPIIMAAAGLFFACAFSRAEVGDPTIETDHPIYAGEGAFQEIEDCVEFATRGEETPQEKAIAMYRWILQHQYHLASPQEWNVGSQTPSVVQPREELIPYDANIARFSYGYGLCGTVHAWNEPYWRALGFAVRRRAFPGHTNSEINYEGAWHAFDTDMAGLVFRSDGVVAGYADIAKNPALVRHASPPVPCYPFAWPADFNAMQAGWNQIAEQGEQKWYKLYGTGYAAQPGVVHLRSGETFTRWFDRDHYGGLEKRRFWHADANRKGGPFRDWTYVNTGHANHPAEFDSKLFRGNASYCNADFLYRPDFNTDTYLEGVAEQTGNMATSDGVLISSDGKPASITFFHTSPYVIAGDPEDDLNPMTGKATGGLVLSGEAKGEVEAEVSTDQGLSWRPAGPLKNQFEIDLTELVKGRYGWLVRFSLEGESGLRSVAFTTTCQMNQAMYPRLKEGGSRIIYRAASRGVVAVKPNFAVSEERIAKVEVQAFRSPNMAYIGHKNLRDLAYGTTNNKPGEVVFRVDAPGNLLQITAAAKFKVRVPPPENCDFRLEVSSDEGKSWRPVGQADLPADNEYSSGWMYGQADLSQSRIKSALIKAHVYQNGYSTGIFDLRAYGLYQTAKPQAAVVTYGWREGEQAKQHSQQIPAGAVSHTFEVPTGAKIVDEFVRIEVK